MANLFPRWSNTAFRVALIALIAGVGSLVLTPLIYMRTPYASNQYFPVDQPVQFDHRHHVRDDGIDCRYCHNLVERSWTAGVPTTALCMGCHNQVWPESPMLEPVRRSYFSGTPIPWNRVHRLPQFVYFNHSIHVNRGIGCASCHGRVDEMPLVYQVERLTMSWCLDCHREPERHLRPLDRITDMSWRPPAQPGSDAELEYGRKLAASYGTRKLTHCTTCHR
jgi:hypothetical protein